MQPPLELPTEWCVSGRASFRPEQQGQCFIVGSNSGYGHFVTFQGRVGVYDPKLAVAIKMTEDGLDPSVLDLDPDSPSPNSVPGGDPASVVLSVRKIKDDPAFAEYFKMLQEQKGAFFPAQDLFGNDFIMADELGPHPVDFTVVGKNGKTVFTFLTGDVVKTCVANVQVTAGVSQILNSQQPQGTGEPSAAFHFLRFFEGEGPVLEALAPPDVLLQFDTGAKPEHVNLETGKLSASKALGDDEHLIRKWGCARTNIGFDHGIHSWEIRIDESKDHSVFVGVICCEPDAGHVQGMYRIGEKHISSWHQDNKSGWAHMTNSFLSNTVASWASHVPEVLDQPIFDMFQVGDTIRLTLDLTEDGRLFLERNGKALGTQARDLNMLLRESPSLRFYPAVLLKCVDDKATLLPSLRPFPVLRLSEFDRLIITPAGVVEELALENRNFQFDITEFTAVLSVHLKKLQLHSNKKLTGDIDHLGRCLGLTDVEMYRTAIYGDIDVFKYCYLLVNVNLMYTQVSGDLAAFRNQRNLRKVYLSDTKIGGDIQNFAAASSLTHLVLGKDVYGELNSLSHARDLEILHCPSSGVCGELQLFQAVPFASNASNPDLRPRHPKLVSLDIRRTAVYGPIDVFASYVALQALCLTGCGTEAGFCATGCGTPYGDIKELQDCPALTTLLLDGTACVGDSDAFNKSRGEDAQCVVAL